MLPASPASLRFRSNLSIFVYNQGDRLLREVHRATPADVALLALMHPIARLEVRNHRGVVLTLPSLEVLAEHYPAHLPPE
jgi:hypothetical protein